VNTPDADQLAAALSRLADGDVPVIDGDNVDTGVFGGAADLAPAPLPDDAEAPVVRAARPPGPRIPPPPLPGPFTVAPLAEVLPDEPAASLPSDSEAGDPTDSAAADPAIRTEPLVSDDIGFDAAGDPAGPFAVAAPAAPVEVFRPNLSRTRPRTAAYQTLEFRRTIIPVLLVCGCLLITLGTAAYAVSPMSPLSALPMWMPPILLVFGLILLAAAVLNMLSVKQQLERS
jgi:hypothetical protein